MSKVLLGGIVRAILAPVVTLFGKYGVDVQWAIDPEVVGLIVGLLCAIWSYYKNKKAVPATS